MPERIPGLDLRGGKNHNPFQIGEKLSALLPFQMGRRLVFRFRPRSKKKGVGLSEKKFFPRGIVTL